MFLKYIDQMFFTQKSLLSLYEAIRQNKAGEFASIDLTILVKDFNYLVWRLNEDLKIYKKQLPSLDLRTLREYINNGEQAKAKALSEEWYNKAHALREYYRELDSSQGVTFLEYCLTFYHFTYYMLLMIRDQANTMKQVA